MSECECCRDGHHGDCLRLVIDVIWEYSCDCSDESHQEDA